MPWAQPGGRLPFGFNFPFPRHPQDLTKKPGRSLSRSGESQETAKTLGRERFGWREEGRLKHHVKQKSLPSRSFPDGSTSQGSCRSSATPIWRVFLAGPVVVARPESGVVPLNCQIRGILPKESEVLESQPAFLAPGPPLCLGRGTRRDKWPEQRPRAKPAIMLEKGAG